jgi:hypothetical protein
MLRGLERLDWPRPLWTSERPRAGVKINAHILLTWALYGDDFKFKLKLLYPREKIT